MEEVGGAVLKIGRSWLKASAVWQGCPCSILTWQRAGPRCPASWHHRKGSYTSASEGTPILSWPVLWHSEGAFVEKRAPVVGQGGRCLMVGVQVMGSWPAAASSGSALCKCCVWHLLLDLWCFPL